ncbi:MAG: right-handed parallel beta-helix repeat-containing protein [Pseudomonadales bacterium]|nr:right-handed parallel beta-helix repeat-containing protein [Pseudomonadales bacterium]
MQLFHQSTGALVYVAISLLMFVLVPASQAAEYYVDSKAGSDSNNGKSPATPWKSLAPVRRARFSAGDDLYLKAGSRFDDQSLHVVWDGTETDWVVVGCYKTNSSGAAIECSGKDPKPELNGTLEVQCAKEGACVTDNSGAAPAGRWNGLIQVDADYVQIKGVSVRDSAGYGVIFNGSKSQQHHHFLAEDIDISHVFMGALNVGRYYKHGAIRDVTVNEFGLCTYYRYSQCSNGVWPSGIGIADSMNAMILVENSTVVEGYGEGLTCLRSSHVVIRGNKVGNVHSGTIYLDNCANSIVENNVLWGDKNGRWRANRAFSGIGIATEDYGDPTTASAVNNIVRNNLVTGLGQCLTASQEPISYKNGKKIGFHAYGNSCIGLLRVNVALWTDTANVDQIVVENNIFYSPNSFEGSCTSGNNSGIQFNNNFWDGRSVPAKCRSKSDLSGDPILLNDEAIFSTLNSVNQPQPKHFALSANSPVFSRGTSLDMVGNFEVGFGSLQNFVGDKRCKISLDPGTSYDFYCVKRQSPPSIGAIDRFSYPPTPPTILGQ